MSSHMIEHLDAVPRIAHRYQQLVSLVKRHCGARWHKMITDPVFARCAYTDEQNLVTGLISAPAAKRIHHARHGGLVDHLLEMIGMYLRLEPILKTDLPLSEVLHGILLHDLHKAYRYYVVDAHLPWRCSLNRSPGSPYNLMTDSQANLYLASKYRLPITQELVNLNAWSHGGFSDDPPDARLPLSRLVYVLDELSACFGANAELPDAIAAATLAQLGKLESAKHPRHLHKVTFYE